MKHRLKSTVAIVLMIMFGIFLPSFLLSEGSEVFVILFGCMSEEGLFVVHSVLFLFFCAFSARVLYPIKKRRKKTKSCFRNFIK